MKNISLPSIIACPDHDNERSHSHKLLKWTYTIAGQLTYNLSRDKNWHPLLDLTDFDSIIIPRQTKWRKFDKIGHMRKPGLLKEEFWGLFAKCDICQAIMTQDVFRYHLEACQGDAAAKDTVTEEESE